jgi:hypothetical protein
LPALDICLLASGIGLSALGSTPSAAEGVTGDVTGGVTGSVGLS